MSRFETRKIEIVGDRIQNKLKHVQKCSDISKGDIQQAFYHRVKSGKIANFFHKNWFTSDLLL